MKLFSILPSLAFGLAVTVGLNGCVLARDSGLWRGTVVVREQGRPDPYTCHVEIDLTHTDDHVTLHHFTTQCQAFAAKWQGDTYDVHGNSLYFKGRDIGWVRSDGSVTMELQASEMRERYPTLADKVLFSWTRVGDSLEFTEEVTYAGREKRATGWLTRVR